MTKINMSTIDYKYKVLLILNYLFLFVGSLSSTLLTKFYFNHKGSSRWVSTLVQCAGFPLLIPPIFIPYFLKYVERRPFSRFTPKIIWMSIGVGFMLGLDSLLFSWGASYLPVSTASLVLSSQLVFTLISSAIIVKQKINFSNLNCVVLLTLSSVLVALSSDHDRPKGLTLEKYLIGFFAILGTGLLVALYLPILEIIYKKVDCYAMVLEMHLVMEMAAALLSTIGMALDGGFSDMQTESQGIFDLGSKMYWLTVCGSLVTFQLCFLGSAGMVFLTSSLTGGVCMAALMAVNVLGGVVVYGDEFGSVKVVSTVLCVWGFCSYVYGLYLNQNQLRKVKEISTKQGMEMISVVNGIV